MTNKIKTAAYETKTIAGKICLKCSLKNKLPEFLVKEMLLFSGRNSIIKINECASCGEEINIACPQCMKAHLLKATRESGKNEIAELITEFFNYEAGHEGYYLDENRDVKI